MHSFLDYTNGSHSVLLSYHFPGTLSNYGAEVSWTFTRFELNSWNPCPTIQ